MSSCLSGGGRTYALDLEIIKSSSTSTRTSQTSSSPSSTLSESSNSPLAISTRKPRTPRKRPNQIYNEAATLLSTVYPNIFSTKNLTKPRKFTKAQESFSYDSSELLLPFRVTDDTGFLLQNQPIREKPSCLIESKVVNFCDKSWQTTTGEVNSHGGGGGESMEMEFSAEFQEDFDAESILDEEIEEGIDSIMGNLSVDQDTLDESNGTCQGGQISQIGSWYGNPMGLGIGGKFELGLGFGLRRGVRALRHVDEGNWWNFSTVDVLQISPKSNTKAATASTSNSRAEKKKNKVEKPIGIVKDATNCETPKEKPSAKAKNPAAAAAGLQLKLNYAEVVNAWSDRGSPFSDELEVAGDDVYARLAQIDLFSEGGGVREASVLRYKEKRRTRLFSKKIRYQVRKVNADQRPRMKGRFVRRPNSCSTSEER